MKRFVTEKDINDFRVSIKQCACPFCKRVGRLIFHGFLRGYMESSSERVIRGRRIFCNNRKKSRGCGRTFSLLLVQFIKGFTITSYTVSRVIDLFLSHKTTAQIAGKVLSHFSCKYVYFLFSRFKLCQLFWRGKLILCRPPDELKSSNPLYKTFNHLKTLFSVADCPVGQFQHKFQYSFL